MAFAELLFTIVAVLCALDAVVVLGLWVLGARRERPLGTGTRAVLRSAPLPRSGPAVR